MADVKRVVLEDVISKKKVPEAVATPIGDAFRSVAAYNNPLRNVDLIRKRKKVKGYV